MRKIFGKRAKQRQLEKQARELLTNGLENVLVSDLLEDEPLLAAIGNLLDTKEFEHLNPKPKEEDKEEAKVEKESLTLEDMTLEEIALVRSPAVISILGEFNDQMMHEVLLQINAIDIENAKLLTENPKLNPIDLPVIVNITSHGGSVTVAKAIYSSLRALNVPLITKVHGMAASAGLLLSQVGDVRFTTEHAEHMYHQLSYGTPPATIGNHFETAIYFEKVQSQLDSIFLNRTEVDQEFLNKYADKDLLFFADEALKLGFFDGIVNLDGTVTVKE